MAIVKAQYDDFASTFSELREIRFFDPIELYTMDKVLLPPLLDEHGSLAGKRVLDLACGEGFHTRRLKALQCDYILGVDISSELIKLARDLELKDPKGIEYMVADAKQLSSSKKPFDLVIGWYLLHYARTKEELFTMVYNIYQQLAENQYFIGVTTNPTGNMDAFDQSKYGFIKHVRSPSNDGLISDGTEIFQTFLSQSKEPVCTFSIYYFSRSTYEQAFKEAGFGSLEWINFQCDPTAPNKDFLDDYIQCPDSICIRAKK